jgi:alkanesulfonate monooxygenase SsuD/methylene tetrahydromethanopterin reductase-like flavin-dependent oxidoreductase (luciferase family)
MDEQANGRMDERPDGAGTGAGHAGSGQEAGRGAGQGIAGESGPAHGGPHAYASRSARRHGLTIPLDGFDAFDLPAHRELFQHATAAGFTDLWSSETNGADGLTPLALASVWAPTARLGSAILPVHTRGPALLAMSAAALAEAAPGRFVLGIGASSPAIVERWNGVPFDQPFARVRDTLRFLQRALAGEKVDEVFPTFAVRGFRLSRPPRVAPQILLAALRPAMIRLGAREADGIITNWLGVEDVPKVLAELRGAEAAKRAQIAGRGESAAPGEPSGHDGLAGHDAPIGADKPAELAARIFVCPTEDADFARALGRTLISSYLTVPAYAEFHRWLGRGELLDPMWKAWDTGDRRSANALVPDEVVDSLLVHGTAEQCREHIERYAAAGIDTPILALLPTPELGAVQAATKADAQAQYLADTISALAPIGR